VFIIAVYKLPDVIAKLVINKKCFNTVEKYLIYNAFYSVEEYLNT